MSANMVLKFTKIGFKSSNNLRGHLFIPRRPEKTAKDPKRPQKDPKRHPKRPEKTFFYYLFNGYIFVTNRSIVIPPLSK